MNQLPQAIPGQPTLRPGEDFFALRREGIGYIEQLAGKVWTDYNLHDPGITLLEAVCYAITDVTYRLNWEIRDILTPEAPGSAGPYPDQAFFSAREILTVNPATTQDLRRLLIDLPAVANAWVVVPDGPATPAYYAWCDRDQLILGWEPSSDPAVASQKVVPAGIYDVLLELEEESDLGDLNDRKIEHRYLPHDAVGTQPVIMELRFPDNTAADAWERFTGTPAEPVTITVTSLGAARDYDLLSDPARNTEADRDAYLQAHWNYLLFLSFRVDFPATGDHLPFANVTLRLFGGAAARQASHVAELVEILKDAGTGGIVARFRRKAAAAASAVASARTALMSRRQLDEDYRCIRTVQVDEVAVCADVEVAAEADIEWVQGRIWFEIEQYFNAPIRFHTLQELLDAGEPVEQIFEGPETTGGFLRSEELDASLLRPTLRVSDIIDRLMDIDGVLAVNRLQLTRYDTEGKVVRGIADPAFQGDAAIFDPDKESASWLLYLGSQRQPRLYRNRSRFLFLKNGLPFLPRMDEANDTLVQLRGTVLQGREKETALDLGLPRGTYRNPEEYYPIQYGLPPFYGVGPAGLPAHVSAARVAQARQLKAYLMLFEQMLGDMLAQLAHTADLFSIDPHVKRTAFAKHFSEAVIAGFDAIRDPSFTPAALEALAESEAEFLDRRNRFLDHLLARFGEQFGEYALLLSQVDGRRKAQRQLIDDKIAFLKAAPVISHDRARAFNYRLWPHFQENEPGIKQRVSLLLGYPDLRFRFNGCTALGAGKYRIDYRLADTADEAWLEGSVRVVENGEAEARWLGYHVVVETMGQPDAWKIVTENGQLRLALQGDGDEIGRSGLLSTSADAQARRDELIAWSANERMIVVEHLLLRPRFHGDALYPACTEGSCKTCGDEDPYSFRLTFVLPAWATRYADNLDLRRFAERTIRQETPAHLVAKSCWVDNEGVNENPCDPALDQLAKLIIEGTVKGEPPDQAEACDCARAILHVAHVRFTEWFSDKVIDYLSAEALKEGLTSLLVDGFTPKAIKCNVKFTKKTWAAVTGWLVVHFTGIASTGWQFERFEEAWFAWRRSDARIDWSRERLQARVEAMLRVNAVAPAALDYCDCAEAILRAWGAAFHQWMEANIGSGSPPDFTKFHAPAISLCGTTEFKPGTAAAIRTLLTKHYAGYTEVSYRLRVVLRLLAGLRNSYPAATLHDCDDGSDFNPVRLDTTQLGDHKLQPSSS